MTQKSAEQILLAALPGTIPQLIAKTGVSRPTVFLWMKRMRTAKRVHIKYWRRTSGCCTPYYVAGDGVDAPRPGPQSSAQYQRRHYLKHRQAVEKEARAKRKQALIAADILAKRPNTWIAILGGGA